MPLGYAAIAYLYEAYALEFKASLNAGRIGRYIYGHERMWQYQRVRLVELIEFAGNTQPIRQRVFDLKGKQVLEEGAVDGRFTLVRSAPIVIAGNPVASIELETSLDPLIRNALWVALFSGLLGFAAYFAVRLFPLRVLDRTIGDLEQRNMRFDAALTNMPHGLCMFDVDRRLVVCNQRYAEMYALPPELTRPGTPLQAILDFRRSIGNAPLDRRSYLAVTSEVVAKAVARTFRAELEDGRIVGVSHNPMPDRPLLP